LPCCSCNAGDHAFLGIELSHGETTCGLYLANIRVVQRLVACAAVSLREPQDEPDFILRTHWLGVWEPFYAANDSLTEATFSQRFDGYVMEQIKECDSPDDMVTVLRMYRFKTQRLVRTFFDDIASRLQARKLMKPYSDQLKELRSKLKTNNGDFTFLPPLQYPHKVRNKHFFFATVFPTVDFPSLVISLCMYLQHCKRQLRTLNTCSPTRSVPSP
jgi:hypothetical protein